MKLSNALLGILNTVTLLISLLAIAAGIWLATKHNNDCARLLQWPALALGLLLLALSVAGLLGSLCRSRPLLVIYLLALFLLFLLLLAFTVAAFFLTNRGAGRAVSGRGFREYRLGDYSTWLQRHVVDRPAYWRKIKSCLLHSKVCRKLEDDDAGDSLSSFYQQHLSPIQSGCCKPPLACNFTFVNATTWNNATNMTASSDCEEWSNEANQLCFNCQSCKAGVLQTLKSNWKKLAITNGSILALLVLVYTVGCCAISNCRKTSYQQRPPNGSYVKA